jgi:hypothetical protein
MVQWSSPNSIRTPRSTFVYAALAFDELGEALIIWLKSLGVSKRPRPFRPRLCIQRTRVRRAENNDSKWLVDSDRATLLGCARALKAPEADLAKVFVSLAS